MSYKLSINAHYGFIMVGILLVIFTKTNSLQCDNIITS